VNRRLAVSTPPLPSSVIASSGNGAFLGDFGIGVSRYLRYLPPNSCRHLMLARRSECAEAGEVEVFRIWQPF
jgi:hypothetical protein